MNAPHPSETTNMPDPRRPNAPIIGIGFAVTLVEARNMARLIMHQFAGCHTWQSVIERALDMKDEQFLNVVIAFLAVGVMIWALIGWLRGR